MLDLVGAVILITSTLSWMSAPGNISEVKGISTINDNIVVNSSNNISPTPIPRPKVRTIIKISPFKKSPNLTKASATKTSTATSSDTSLILMKQINDYRSSKNLPAFTTEGYTCGFAVTRANEITGSFSHDGFNQRIESKTLPYPSYSGVSENIAMNSDPNAVVPGWINSPGHNENLLRDHPHACVGKSGNYYVFLTWKP